MTTLYPTHKEALMRAARAPDHPDFSKPNERLDKLIQVIKSVQPEAFLTAADLKARCFVHTPPCREGQEPTPYARACRDRLSPFEKAERIVTQQQNAQVA